MLTIKNDFLSDLEHLREGFYAKQKKLVIESRRQRATDFHTKNLTLSSCKLRTTRGIASIVQKGKVHFRTKRSNF